ncbi:MAG TPA: cache domain-containing protein, partial [Candidatus Ozemobacteraceae bacterium]|nr:cache domain-containing protein [Candidatus Ozemobacteraceae bacterium]
MRSFAVRAVFITILTITLFSSTIFFVTIPALESHIMDQKRELIRELTTSAWNILAKFENDERTGIVTREEAQKQAILQIRNLHYGQQMKDYFWINDMTPRMVVHPYRSDLDGKDLTTFADPDGKRLFVEVVRTVKEHGAGYVSYRWQWKDDSARVVPKLSYVKGFEPWNWVIGTGVYVEDVQNEIRSAKQQLLLISLAILGIASLFLFYLLWDSLRTERKRRLAEQALKNSEEKYRLLVESAGECIVMAIGNERLFANQSMLQLLGYTPEAFAPLRIDEIIGLTEDERASGHSYPVRLMRGEAVPSRYETFLRTSQGERREVTLSLSRITIQEKTGFIAVATEITRRRQREIEQERLLGELNETVLFLNRSVKNICRRDLVTVKAGSTLGDVCRKMVEENLPAVLVAEEAGGVRGLLSREGAFRRLADSSRAWSEPIGAAAIEQSAGIPQQAMVAEAVLALEKHEFHPLLVMAEDGSVAGVLTEREISLLNRYSPTVLLREIAAAESSEALIRANRRLPELVRVLVRNGIRTTHINRIITQNSDAVLERAV